MRHTFETEFELGQRVFYKLPDSPEGIVTGISYSLTTNVIHYYVTFDPLMSEVSCLDWELSTEKTIV